MHGCCVNREHGYRGGCTPDTCMELPAGRTCHDCAHLRRCVLMFGGDPESTSCGWFPRRFAPAERTPASQAGEARGVSEERP